MTNNFTSVGDRVLERSENTLITRLYQIQQNLLEKRRKELRRREIVGDVW